MEKTYTKQQLIDAMIKYDQHYIDNPDKYDTKITETDDVKQYAIDQVNQLISFIE